MSISQVIRNGCSFANRDRGGPVTEAGGDDAHQEGTVEGGIFGEPERSRPNRADHPGAERTDRAANCASIGRLADQPGDTAAGRGWAA